MQNILLSIPFVGKFLRDRPMLLRVLENISWLSIDKVIRMGVGLFVGVWVARYLGPSGYGALSYAVAFVTLFGALATLGLDQIVVRELVKQPEKEGELIGTSFYLKLMGGVAVLFLSTGIALLIHRNDLRTVLMIFFVSLGIVAQAVMAIDFFFQAKILSKYTVIAQNIAFFIISGIKILLIVTKQSVEWFAIMSFFEMIVVAIFLIIFYNKHGAHINYWKFDGNVALSLLKDSWPLILSSIAIMIYMRTDQIMIRNMLGEREVGLYSAAVSLSEVWYMIPGIIVNSTFPAIVEAKKISKDLYYTRLEQLFSVMAWIAILIAIFMTIAGKFIILFLLGQDYIEASRVLSIYTWAGIFVFLGVARSQWIVAENLQTYGFFFTSMAAILNIVMNIVFIKYLRLLGAACATLISNMFSVIVFPMFFSCTRKSSFMLLKSPIYFFRRNNEKN